MTAAEQAKRDAEEMRRQDAKLTAEHERMAARWEASVLVCAKQAIGIAERAKRRKR